MAKARARRIRKSIRIDGKLVTEYFTSKTAAADWYNHQYNLKRLGEAGTSSHEKGKVLFKEFTLGRFSKARVKELGKGKLTRAKLEQLGVGEFMRNRMLQYPKSTWYSDLQRLEDYLIPDFGNMLIHKVDGPKVRALLVNLVQKHGLSVKTRDRVRALISAIYNEALNREAGALVNGNPTFGLTFKTGKRVGSKEPSYLHSHMDGIKYFKAAKELSTTHLVIGGLGLNGGLRKQEMIALKWKRLDFEGHTIEVAEKYVQMADEIVPGTKRGEESIRYVPMSEELEMILKMHQSVSKFAGPEDFVLCDKKGRYIRAHTLYRIHMQTCRAAGVNVTVHGLRHTFGREFNERSGGNVGVLKDILGHSNLSTTQIYSKLGKERLKSFRDVVSYSDLQGHKQTDKDNR